MRDDGEILKMHGTFEKFKYNYSEPLGEVTRSLQNETILAFHGLNKSLAWSCKIFATLTDL